MIFKALIYDAKLQNVIGNKIVMMEGFTCNICRMVNKVENKTT